MNDNERKIYEKYEEQGYDVIHTGVPDLILLKDGEIQFVEIKNAADPLRKSQMRSIAILRKHGIKARVERIPTVQKSALLAEWTKTNQTMPRLASPRLANPIQSTPDHSKTAQSRPQQSIPTQSKPPQSTPTQPRPIQFKGGEI